MGKAFGKRVWGGFETRSVFRLFTFQYTKHCVCAHLEAAQTRGLHPARDAIDVEHSVASQDWHNHHRLPLLQLTIPKVEKAIVTPDYLPE